MIDAAWLPHDRRYFVHKRLLGIGKLAVQTFVPGGGLAVGLFDSVTQKQAGAAAKFGNGGGGGVRGLPRTDPNEFFNAQCIREGVSDWSSCGDRRRAAAGPGGSVPSPGIQGCQPQTCLFPSRWDPASCRCRIFLGDRPGPNGGGSGVMAGPGSGPGDPFHHPPGHHHPIAPEIFTDTSTRDGIRRRCPRKYKLGEDNMCYFNLPRNSRFRKWSPGRKPLFTGGDLNAIALTAKLADRAEEIFKDTNPAKKAVARNYRANWRKPLKK